MNRLIFSIIGVALTFVWIIYTAPPKQDKVISGSARIKTINRSGSASMNRITQPIYKKSESGKTEASANVLARSASKAPISQENENE